MSHRLIASVLLAAAVSAFAATGVFADSAAAPSAPAADAPASASAPSAPPRADYILTPGDLIRVIVFQEDNLTIDVRVSNQSTITLPLIGSIDVKGISPHEAQEIIRKRYDADYLVNPQVNLLVTEYARRSVNVIGSVNTPGAVLFPQEEGMTLLDAITRAGGFSRLADKKRLKLTRNNPETGGVENYTINADDLIAGTAKDQWNLLKDDVIFVPERIL